MEQFKFVITGHVDHGKSTLIGRLLYDTGSLPPDKICQIKKASKTSGREIEFSYMVDHLQEERDQGITIDTSQVFFKTAKREYVIIDAPGHVEFIKNMITGASQAEGAVLIIDAKEGIRTQTRRHAYILSMLGIRELIIAVNKMDTVGFDEDRFKHLHKELTAFLESIDIEPAFCIPICAIDGANITSNSQEMAWYKGVTLAEGLDALKGRGPIDKEPFLFPVQDLYSIDGDMVAAGRVEAGLITRGKEVKVLPGNTLAKVEAIKKYPDNKKECAYAGESIGITLKDNLPLRRGDIMVLPGREPRVADRFCASVFWMSKEPLKGGGEMLIKCATQEAACTIEEIRRKIHSSTLEVIEEDREVLNNLEVGEVVIKADRPIAVKLFKELGEMGRFVFIRNKEVCAGGIITAIE